MITYKCGHKEELGIGDFTSKEYVCASCVDNSKIKVFFGEVDPEVMKNARRDGVSREKRRAAQDI